MFKDPFTSTLQILAISFQFSPPVVIFEKGIYDRCLHIGNINVDYSALVE